MLRPRKSPAQANQGFPRIASIPFANCPCWPKVGIGGKLWENIMLYTIAVVLIVLWLLGFTFHVAGGLIHLLLVIAVIMIIFNLISGRRGL
jgi:hypothetical protein